MSLQELKNTGALKVDEIAVKLVTVFLESVFYKLSGHWQWDMETDDVFCSDVLLAMPGFAGTKAIFHPDDIDATKQALQQTASSLDKLQFRIITTYGKVKQLSGRNIVIEKIEDETCCLPEQEAQSIFAEMANKSEQEHLRLLQSGRCDVQWNGRHD